MSWGSSVHAAAAPASLPARSGAAIGETEQLSGGSGLVPVAIFMLAILAIMIFDDDERPESP
jgi:hypothetical protein